jgi:hypothetical protein
MAAAEENSNAVIDDYTDNYAFITIKSYSH